METIPQEICNQVISDKLNGYAYIIDFESYEVVYMTGLLATRLKAEGRGIGKKCFEVIHAKSSPCSFCPKDNVLQDKTHKWQHHHQENGRHFSNVDHLLEYNNKKYLVHTKVDV